MKIKVVVTLCVLSVVVAARADGGNRDSRKLFGGYRITPKFCKPTRKPQENLGGPNICMFNHECNQRNGQVVGACMDGFLFGACCQLTAGSVGELMESESVTLNTISNSISKKPSQTLRPTTMDIMSNGMSQIAQSLLSTGAIPTAQDNAVYQVGGSSYFATSGITHADNGDVEILPSTVPSILLEDRKTTVRDDEAFTPLIHISISNAPIYGQTPSYEKPVFKPKPQKPSNADKYVLVPTIAPPTKPNRTESISTTRKPPSTSYVFSSSPPTKRPGYTTSNKPPSTSYVYSSTRPSTIKRPQTTESLYTYPTQPTLHSTFASSPDAFATSSQPTRRPTITTHVPGPSFSVASTPVQVTGAPSPPPTVIVLGPIEESSSSGTTTSFPTRKPINYATPAPVRKPVTQLTINNHITQNIYSTVRPPTPTVLITPKPGVSTSYPIRRPTTEAVVASSDVQTSADDLINFPPVRNPNLNTSVAAVVEEIDATTPVFVEDQVLDQKVESFVNKIIEGLQDPFQDLKDVVYNNKTSSSTTSKPAKKPATTTKKPVSKPPTRRPTNKPASVTTRKPSTTTKKRPTNRRPTTTTTESYIEQEEVTSSTAPSGDYKTQCGVRPLMKSGRIVGGKGASFGEFPWQVLVRESTWLGLFTKNKCGGVLISSRYVMTAAHCQPGFLASLVAVFGEFDISGDLESKRPISRNVKRVIVHRQYDAATFENDLALLELEHPVQFDSHIVPICLPKDSEDFTGRMATVTGWGRLKYGGGVPSVLQEVQVPIMENQVCQEMFRTAGHSKVILESFLCAGYANGQKDSCEGDSGGPLVLQRSDGRYQLAGTVSHGIKCAAPYLPGVYMRTTYYKPWITSITGIQ